MKFEINLLDRHIETASYTWGACGQAPIEDSSGGQYLRVPASGAVSVRRFLVLFARLLPHIHC